MSLLNGVPNKTAFWELSCYSHCPSCGWGSKDLGPAVKDPSLEKALEAEAAILCKKATTLKEAADKVAADKIAAANADKLFLERLGIDIETTSPWPMLGKIDR